MPVDHFHAFAGGGARRYADLIGGAADDGPPHHFDTGATLDPSVLLGPSACCANALGGRERILVGAGTVLRGVLRIDAFGDGHICIGDGCYVGDDTIISAAARVDIADHVLIAHGVQIFDNNTHPLTAAARRTHFEAILAGRTAVPTIDSVAVHIGTGAWIGMNSLIMKGVRIGAGAVVAAGSVVVSDIPAGWLVGGNPARPLKPVEADAACLPVVGPDLSVRWPDYGATKAVTSGNCQSPVVGGVNWYPPVMAAAPTAQQRLYSHDYLTDATRLLERLEHDAYTQYLRHFYAEGRERFGADWRYADIVTVLLCLSDLIRPHDYLEIGVRRGRSACAVASRAPECRMDLFDMWVNNYAGMSNPGPVLVAAELAKVGHKPGLTRFIDGDSHQTLPAHFAAHPDAAYDLITVDGDHSLDGAAQDLFDVLPRLRIGGAVVFDDIAHPAHPELWMLWQRMVVEDPRFSSFSYREAGYGVGFAIRMA
jgi:acetyltransferase-like isoleucine patch superfamily enzyme/predicted O-methyltransferase YrrM